MSNLNISNFADLDKWLGNYDANQRRILEARFAARMLPYTTDTTEEFQTRFTLKSFRAVLTLSTISKNSGSSGSLTDALKHSATDLSSYSGRIQDEPRAFFAAQFTADAAGQIKRSDGNKKLDRAFLESKLPEVFMQALELDSDESVDKVFEFPLWHGIICPNDLKASQDKLTDFLSSQSHWRFWRRFYSGLWEGHPQDWSLNTQIANIPQGVWDGRGEGEGAVVYVAGAIQEVETRAKNETSNATLIQAPPSANEIARVLQRVGINRDALAVSAAGLLEQLNSFREVVRGSNSLDIDIRDEMLDFVDDLSSSLTTLLQSLPIPGQAPSEEEAHRLAVWLKTYWSHTKHNLAKYGDAKKVSDATVPTGIILGFTGIGAMLGSSLTGAVVGQLITNQIKPADAAKALTSPKGAAQNDQLSESKS